MLDKEHDSTLLVMIRNLDDKLRLMMDEAEKRNGQRFDAQQEAVGTAMIAAEKAVNAAMAAAEKAVTKAEISTDKRFEGVNEFRSALADQATNLLPRVEYNVQHIAATEKQASLDKRMDEMQNQLTAITSAAVGKTTGISNVGSIIMGIIALMAALAAVGTWVNHFSH